MRTAVHVPFVLHEGLAIVEASAGGHEGRFVLDTGCGLTSLDAAWAAERGIRPDAESPIKTAHRSGTVAATLGTTSFRLGDLAVDSQKVVLVALDGVSRKFGIAIDGVIGFDVFTRGIADIDFRTRIFSIGDLRPATGDLIPIDLSYRIPIANATIVLGVGQALQLVPGNDKLRACPTLTARMAIDLGSTRLDVRLLGPFVDTHQQALQQLELTPGSFGTGVGGEIDGHLTHFAEVRLGAFTIHAPSAGITRSREGALGLNIFDGTIGSSVFHDRRLVLDYARNQVIVA